MVVASPRYAPMMFDEPDVGRYVRGELYRVDDMVLAALDRLEALDLPGNIRTTLDVLPIHACVPVSAWAYFKARHLAVPVHTDYLGDYQDRRFTGPQTSF
jgi:gamma-glutamylaminecyclotransferase